jgi:hypothetical protein
MQETRQDVEKIKMEDGKNSCDFPFASSFTSKLYTLLNLIGFFYMEQKFL